MEDIFNVITDNYSEGFNSPLTQGGMIDPMQNAFGIIYELFPGSWFTDAQQHFGLSDSEIVQSVKEASAFFHMDNPLIVHEYRNTGVFTGLPFTDNDDIMVFNREQMQNMGITDKEAFDLVMTHECTHRMLQNNDLFSQHQEELCCDFISGVRAGLNNMDITQVENALADQPEGTAHPIGSLRVEALNEGQQYAEHYMAETGHAPTFDDCLEHFRDAFPEKHFDAESHEDDGIKEYTQSEIDRHVASAERDMHDAKSRIDYYRSWISKHGTDSVMVSADKGLRDAERDYEHAKAELHKWKYMHPDSKGFADENKVFEDSDTLHSYTDGDINKAKDAEERKHKTMMTKYNAMNSCKKDSPEYEKAEREYKAAKKEWEAAKRKVQNMVNQMIH